MKVEADTMVSVSFRLFDAAGDLVDEVVEADPLVYLHGYAQIIPGLESGLLGAAAGETRSLLVPPDEAFGERDPEALLEIDPNDFPEADDIAVGAEIVATGPNGVESVHRVVEVDEDAIMVDLNHPLAGQTVRFEVKVCSVRAATDSELDAAHQDVGERIAHAGLVVYGSQSDDSATGLSRSESLVQIRMPRRSGHPEQDDS